MNNINFIKIVAIFQKWVHHFGSAILNFLFLTSFSKSAIENT